MGLVITNYYCIIFTFFNNTLQEKKLFRD